MTLLTQERLKVMFQQSKERQKKKKEHQSKLKLEARKEKYKEIDKRKKEALQSERKKRMDNLSTLAPKTQQKLRKPSTERSFKVYHSNLYEREPNEEELYLTREELMDAEDRGEGAIRWDIWDKLIAEGRKWNEEHFKH